MRLSTRTSLRKIIAAARRQAKIDKPNAKALRLSIKNVETFIMDNYDFIGFYDDDAGVEDV